ncbi:MAG: hypothetical protein AB7E55_21870 [Pigmentiphaga sp.]
MIQALFSPLQLSPPTLAHRVVMALPVKGEKVANYFDNLLPDSDAIRRRVVPRQRATFLSFRSA